MAAKVFGYRGNLVWGETFLIETALKQASIDTLYYCRGKHSSQEASTPFCALSDCLGQLIEQLPNDLLETLGADVSVLANTVLPQFRERQCLDEKNSTHNAPARTGVEFQSALDRVGYAIRSLLRKPVHAAK